jgi:hypothetical protein
MSHELIYVICCSSLAISKYYCAFFGYIDTLPLGPCLIDIVRLDNAGILLCLLRPYRYFASWAALPLGLLCLLGYFASRACLLGYFASRAILPLGLLCLVGYFASWAAMPLGLLCLLGYFCLLGFISTLCLAMSHRHCLL